MSVCILKTVQAALLHDTVEDTDTTEEELRAVFGSEVTGMRSYVTEMCSFGYYHYDLHSYKKYKH